MTSPSLPIPGGCVLVARKMLDSDLMDQSPLVVKLWVWLLLKANWKDRDQLRRGQLVATIAEMQEATSHYSGWRKIVPTKDEIRSAYGALSKATRVTVRRTTRGMVITVLNFDSYQDLSSYASHAGAHKGKATEPSAPPHDTEEGERKNILSDFFETLWCEYPAKDGKKEAIRHFKATVKCEDDCQRIKRAMDNYKAMLKAETWRKPKNGATWFNNWTDWENWIPATKDGAEADLGFYR